MDVVEQGFRMGWPEIKAVSLAISIISVWAAIRYRKRPEGVS
jgi:hypothetical protein